MIRGYYTSHTTVAEEGTGPHPEAPRERREGEGVSGAAFLSWVTSYMLVLPAFGMEFVQKIDRKKARKHWPEVVQERLKPDGPTTRLIDIEEDYIVRKQQQLNDLHDRMRKTLPR